MLVAENEFGGVLGGMKNPDDLGRTVEWWARKVPAES
jgi:hypothetical protein